MYERPVYKDNRR